MKNTTIWKLAIAITTLCCLLAGCRTAYMHAYAPDTLSSATTETQMASDIPVPTEPEPMETAPKEPDAPEPAPTEPEQTESVPVEGFLGYAPDDYALALLDAVNQARAEHGLPALVLDVTISQLAYIRAQEAAVQWSHTRPNGLASHSVYPEYGIPWPHCVGENLANYVLQDAARIVDAWMNSEGHRKNILYPDYTGAGMAVYFDGEKYYIANLFFG